MRSVTKLALTLASGVAAAALATAASAAASGHLNPASPAHYVGRCPGVIHFSGWIGSTTPGVVKYQWFRSDGALGPVETKVFRQPGRSGISTTWTLGGIPALPNYAGWEAVHILSPAGPDSNKAPFTLRCLPLAAPPRP